MVQYLHVLGWILLLRSVNIVNGTIFTCVGLNFALIWAKKSICVFDLSCYDSEGVHALNDQAIVLEFKLLKVLNSIWLNIQKQPPELFCRKRCSYKFCKIHRKTPVPEPLFSKVVGQRPVTFLKKRLCDGCFPLTFAIFLRTTFFTEHLRTTDSEYYKKNL